ncbi:MAG: carbohydrate ABC transporter permease [Alphaproteobacteria bacterium]|nr:carbohydrate ABC transporter permease [Alphaproteobacteria bacterium]
MSFKAPIDAFSANPFTVLFGPATRAKDGGFSLLDVLVFGAVTYFGVRSVRRNLARWIGILATTLDRQKKQTKRTLRGLLGASSVGHGHSANSNAPLLARLAHSRLLADNTSDPRHRFVKEEAPRGLATALIWVGLVVGGLVLYRGILTPVLGVVNDYVWLLGKPIIGYTWQHYQSIWIDRAFYVHLINSAIVTTGVVTISLTVGTLAGYAFARTPSRLAFWLLILALIFRALPHSVLVTGYLPVFVNTSAYLAPLWENPLVGWFFRLFNDMPPTFYGQPLAVIMVLVAINQPFTIWMLRSFFQSIPAELDEAARIDGCSSLQAFLRVILPVMWPGVITTGLFSFLLAYNDYLVTSLLLDSGSRTMVPAITNFFNRETTLTDQVEAIAAAVSITLPLLVLVLVFQRQIVAGLTAGAVKG